MQFNYVNVTSDEYQNAIREAKESVIDFLQLSNDEVYSRTGIKMVKVAYDKKDLTKPLIWLTNVKIVPGGYIGEVFEEYEDWKIGMKIEVKAADLMDWAIQLSDGTAFGGYTIALVMAMLNDEERDNMKRQTGIWGFRRKEIGNG